MIKDDPNYQQAQGLIKAAKNRTVDLSDNKIKKTIRDDLQTQRNNVKKNYGKDYMIKNFDLAGNWAKRRCESAFVMTKMYQEKFNQKYTVVKIPQHYIMANFNCPTTLDSLNSNNSLTLAAAIWILDALKACGKLDEACQYLTDEYLTRYDVHIPNVEDTEHCEELICKMVDAIQMRNCDYTEDSGEPFVRYIMDDFNASYNEGVQSKKRDNYDAIIKLIPEEMITNAVNNFKRVCDEFFDAYLYGLEKYETELNSIVKNMSLALHQWEEEFNHSVPQVRSILDMRNPKAMLMDTLKTCNNYSDRIAAYGAKHNICVIKLKDYMTNFCHYCEVTDASLGELIDEDVVAKMHGIKIGNPFEISFATFYLADKRDDYICSVMPAAPAVSLSTCLLPWVLEIPYGRDFGLVKTAYELEDAQTVSDEVNLYEFGANHSMLFEDREKAEKLTKGSDIRMSYAGVIYGYTGMLMPRMMPVVPSLEAVLKREGADDKTVHQVADYIRLLYTMKNKTELYDIDDEDFELEEDELQEEVEVQPDDAAADPEEIAKLKAEIKQLKSHNHACEKQLRTTKEKLDKQAKEIEDKNQELADMRELTFSLVNESYVPEDNSAKKEYKFPYEVKHKITVFGGHESWSREIRQKFTGNIRFIDKDAEPSPTLIKNSDAVFIQYNCLNHPHYWTIVNNAKLGNTRIRYFTNASAIIGAQQIVDEDQQE